MKILVIDDEKYIRRLIGDFLRNEGYDVIEGKDGFDGMDQLAAHTDIGLILLDIRMPVKDGFETYEEIKELTDVPVIFLTAQKEAKHELKGLNLGAYDYITKPFNYDVLSARIRNCLKQVTPKGDDAVVIQDLRIEPTIRQVTVLDQTVALTQKEYDILYVLLYNKRNVVSRDRLLDRVWGYDYEGNMRTVDVHIQTLRAKLKDYGRLIKTVRGAGYYFDVD